MTAHLEQAAGAASGALPAAGEAQPARVVIVGGGFGGLTAARALAGAPVHITLVDRRNYHLFQPLLYQVATAGLSPGDIAHPIRSILRRQRNVRVLLAEAVGIDLAARRLRLRDGTLEYDHLILAAGAENAYFGHDDWVPYAPGLKDLDDALEIRRRMLLAFEQAEREDDAQRRRALLTFVIVGGGPTGVELAGAVAEIACRTMARDFRSIDPREARILLLEAGPQVLPAFPPRLSGRAAASLTRLRVEVHTGTAVRALGPGYVDAGGGRIAAATVVWAAGVRPVPLGHALGVPLDRAGRVVVQPDLTLPGHPEVSVVGDLAAAVDAAGRPLPGLAPVAMQEGRHAAANIARRCRGLPALPFRYVDRGTLATIGRAAAVAQFGRVQLSGLVAWVAWLTIHIFFLIGFRNRFVVLFDWAWAYLTFQRAARLITGTTVTPPAAAAPPCGPPRGE